MGACLALQMPYQEPEVCLGNVEKKTGVVRWVAPGPSVFSRVTAGLFFSWDRLQLPRAVTAQ